MIDEDGTAAPDDLTAGAMLRAAREEQGLHIAVLAAAIKVSPRKLDALENDRYDELPDATFVRALAQTMCRALKIDPQPVLARLPQQTDSGLELAAGGLNMPFRDRPVRNDPAALGWPQRPLLWAGALLLLAAAAIALVPTGLWRGLFGPGGEAAPEPAASAGVPAVTVHLAPAGASAVAPTSAAASGPAAASGVALPIPEPASPPVAEASTAVPAERSASPATPSAPVLTTTAASWVELKDATGQVLWSRTVVPGEVVSLEGALPLRLTIGNAAATRIVFRGGPVDLGPSTRDNVARIELN